MIKFLVLIKESDIPLGYIQGKDKRELGLQLVKLCRQNHMTTKDVKLICIQLDKKENL